MQARHFDSYTSARSNLRSVLDAAQDGCITTIDRDRQRFAVVDAVTLQAQLSRLLPSGAVVAAEGGGWVAFLPGLPVSGEGEDLDGALDDLLEALRDYAEDWNDHLRTAPNHQASWALVALGELSDDDQLRAWLLSGGPDDPR